MGAVMERRDGEDDGREIGRELPEGGNRHGSGNGEERRGRRWKRDRGESYQREAIDMGAVMERRDGEDDGREIGERATRGRQ